MGKSNWTNGRLLRAEQSGNLNANSSNRLFQLEFVNEADTDSTIAGGGKVPNTNNSEHLFTDVPMAIKEYKVTVATSDLCVLHQFYGPTGQTPNWNTSLTEFHEGLKQWKMVPGSKQKYPIRWQNGSITDGEIDVLNTAHSNHYAIRTLHFDTDYIKRRGKKGYWKNGLRPIILSKNKGQVFGFTISNLSGNSDTFFYAIVEIKRWSLLE